MLLAKQKYPDPYIFIHKTLKCSGFNDRFELIVYIHVVCRRGGAEETHGEGAVQPTEATQDKTIVRRPKLTLR